MKISQHIAKLLGPFENKLRILGTAVINKALKAPAFYIVHDDNKTVVLINNIDDAGKMRVFQFFQHFCFGNQSLTDDFRIVASVFPDFFYGPCLVRAFI